VPRPVIGLSGNEAFGTTFSIGAVRVRCNLKGRECEHAEVGSPCRKPCRAELIVSCGWREEAAERVPALAGVVSALIASFAEVSRCVLSSQHVSERTDDRGVVRRTPKIQEFRERSRRFQQGPMYAAVHTGPPAPFPNEMFTKDGVPTQWFGEHPAREQGWSCRAAGKEGEGARQGRHDFGWRLSGTRRCATPGQGRSPLSGHRRFFDLPAVFFLMGFFFAFVFLVVFFFLVPVFLAVPMVGVARRCFVRVGLDQMSSESSTSLGAAVGGTSGIWSQMPGPPMPSS